MSITNHTSSCCCSSFICCLLLLHAEIWSSFSHANAFLPFCQAFQTLTGSSWSFRVALFEKTGSKIFRTESYMFYNKNKTNYVVLFFIIVYSVHSFPCKIHIFPLQLVILGLCSSTFYCSRYSEDVGDGFIVWNGLKF